MNRNAAKRLQSLSEDLLYYSNKAVQHMQDAFVQRYTGTHRENQDRDNKTPEIHLLAVPERKTVVRRLARLA